MISHHIDIDCPTLYICMFKQKGNVTSFFAPIVCKTEYITSVTCRNIVLQLCSIINLWKRQLGAHFIDIYGTPLDVLWQFHYIAHMDIAHVPYPVSLISSKKGANWLHKAINEWSLLNTCTNNTGSVCPWIVLFMPSTVSKSRFIACDGPCKALKTLQEMHYPNMHFKQNAFYQSSLLLGEKVVLGHGWTVADVMGYVCVVYPQINHPWPVHSSSVLDWFLSMLIDLLAPR